MLRGGLIKHQCPFRVVAAAVSSTPIIAHFPFFRSYLSEAQSVASGLTAARAHPSQPWRLLALDASRWALIALEAGSSFRPMVASNPKPHSGGECGCSPDREQKQVYLVQGNTDVLKEPTNHESAGDSEENVGPRPEAVVPSDLATRPTGQCCGKQPNGIEHPRPR